ncbi:ABC transporter ATP-binding protein [Subtercola sp. YIM 133946]|uniref:ABC transporter ATP-binding protein n=1 Tax=Subtercola sp. YIM 133946 TaxID=3118909 RepID=UPI002F94783B
MTVPVLSAEAVGRDYRTGAGIVTACADVTLSVDAGELLIVRGKSGAGKTTLLTMLGTLDAPTRGVVRLFGRDIASLSDDELTAFRQQQLGFVFQTFGLLPLLTAAENVELPLRLAGVAPRRRAARAAEMLDRVGLADQARQRAPQLSGGQQQRVALARALVSRPTLLVADEPTGQLDSENAEIIMALIRSVVSETGAAAVVATHDPLFAGRADHVIELRDGRVAEAAAS